MTPRTLMVLASLLASSLPAQQVVRLCDSNNPPYVLGDENGGPPDGGTVVELARAIFAQLPDVELEISVQPWLRCLSEARHGSFDGVLKLIPKPDRAEYLEFTAPLYDSVQRFFFRADRFPDGVSWSSVEDLAPYTLGIVEGSSYGPVVDEAIRSKVVEVESTMDDEINFRKLQAGRIDLLPNNEVLARAAIRDLGAEGEIVGSEQVTSSSPVCLGLVKGSPAVALIPRIDEAIAALDASGERDRILADW